MAAEADEGAEVEEHPHPECSREQLLQEIETLRKKLGAANSTIEQTNQQMELQKIRTRQLIAAWRLRLDEGDDKLARESKRRDTEMKEVTSKLMYLEGALRKEQRSIINMLSEKDKLIGNQQRQINSITTANVRLMDALNKLRNDRVSFGDNHQINGLVEREDTDSGHSTNSSFSSVNTHSTKKASSTNRVRFQEDGHNVRDDTTPSLKWTSPITPAALKHMRANTISYF
ncbi:disabled homolog 2-interacting protein-like [Saccoglossus kowalevskii]|uniref:Uncharacterized protein LOC100374516 n=1 Tax=Saccoglossus kowalevskii TaxID=10224 RepID=A0ABM0GL86_SACKO|nr:PREDICTED: uncharacterized protein LOC100374516 [Saccoglossus kowalevskii]